MDLIKVAEQAFATGKQHPQFFPGDTITVAYRITCVVSPVRRLASRSAALSRRRRHNFSAFQPAVTSFDNRIKDSGIMVPGSLFFALGILDPKILPHE